MKQRTIAAGALLISAGMSVFLALVLEDIFVLFDAFAFLFLAYFINKGRIWAIYAAMIYWSISKIMLIEDGVYPLMQMFFWGLYMLFFYNALKAEGK